MRYDRKILVQKYIENVTIAFLHFNSFLPFFTDCARDEAAYQGSFQCLGYGNYRTLQCTKSMEQQTKCSCIDDDDGNIISKSSAEINEKTCENLLKKLRNEQSDDSRQTVPDTTDTLVTDVYVYDD